MAHLTADQFVDVAEDMLAEADMPHLASCPDCRRQLADLRAMMTEAASVATPEPSPLYWDQMSARVRDAVAEDSARAHSWRERLLQPRVWFPALVGAAAILLAVQLRVSPNETVVLPTLPAPLPMTVDRGALPMPEPSLPPLGKADDPQLSLVADFSTTLDWDEMRDEIAIGSSSGSSDAVFDALTIDEQRELQRLLADEMAQPAVPETRS